MFDVVIAGAGPAGSIAALVLARAGARVLLIDRARFPRDKLCGDTLNPGALAILHRLGAGQIADAGLPVGGMIVTGSAVQVVGRYGAGVSGRAVSRAVLDAALVHAASAAGAELEEGVLVRDAIRDADAVRGVTIAGRERGAVRVAARVTIAADGAASRLARGLGLAHHAARPRRWAVGAYFSGVSGTSDLGEMHIRSGWYIGVAALPSGLTNVCVVTADREMLKRPNELIAETVRADAMLAERFAGARQVISARCLGPLAVDARACGMPGLLLAGDAAGFIDPMTGDGLRFAMRGAELAAQCALDVLEHGVRDAHARLARARRREFAHKWRFNRALRALVSSPLAVSAAARGAALAPQWLQHAIRYAGDLRAA
jgi:flavin-dependent dehydrogenase